MEDNIKLPNYVTEKRGIEIKTAQVDPEDPKSFTVSEEEGARLRSIAMSNSNVITVPQNYNIPDNIHNLICYDAAKKNNEKYQKESEEFTNSVISDNATKEILDEAEATTNLSQFDFGDITEYLNKLEDLSFLEAVSYKKKVDAEIARWKSCESMLKAISELKLDDTTNRELMKINAMEDYKFMESVEDFESHYDANMSKLQKISDKLVSIVDTHKHEMDSTRFLTNEMVHLMKGKLAKLDPSGMNYEYNRSRMETVKNAFENRLDLSYLKNKFEIYLKTNKNNIKKDFKDNANLLNSNRRSKVINDLIRFFNEDIVYALYNQLMGIFCGGTSETYLMMAFIAKVMNTEKKTSKDVWAKVFVLNMSDIYNDIFDIEMVDKDSYTDQVAHAFFTSAYEFVKKNSLIKVLNPSISFGLKPTVRKIKNDCEIAANNAGVVIAPAEDATVF